MENSFNNTTFASEKPQACGSGWRYLVVLSLIDIIPVLVGQPVIVKLLWITITSKKTIDILNCNLALFHNVQYFISILHFILLFLLPYTQELMHKFLFVYVQMGGPMSLSFICMERYVAVIHPTSYPLLRTYRFREVCVVTVWLISVSTAFGSVLAEEYLPSLKEHLLESFSFYLLVLMTIMVVRSSIRIAKTLKKSGPGRDKLHPAKKRAFKTVCATSAVALFCYTPVTVLLRFNVESEYLHDCIIIPVCILFLSAASVAHPVFYLSTQGKLFTCFK